MPEDSNSAAVTPPAETPIENVKAEFNRKLSSLEASNAALQQRIEAFMSQSTPPVSKSEEKRIGSLLFEDADKYAEVVAERAVAKAAEQVSQMSQRQAEQANVVGRLYQDYPELQDSSNPFTKAVLTKHSQLSRSEQQDTRMLRLIALETAAELEIQPVSKRKQSQEGDIYGGRGNSGKQRETALDNKTIEFARLLKLDVNDPKVIASLKARSNK
jgi:hypothetical protein